MSFKEVISPPVKDSDSRGIDLKEITDNELPPSSKPIGKEKFHNEPKENENVGELVASHPIKRLKALLNCSKTQMHKRLNMQWKLMNLSRRTAV